MPPASHTAFKTRTCTRGAAPCWARPRLHPSRPSNLLQRGGPAFRGGPSLTLIKGDPCPRGSPSQRGDQGCTTEQRARNAQNEAACGPPTQRNPSNGMAFTHTFASMNLEASARELCLRCLFSASSSISSSAHRRRREYAPRAPSGVENLPPRQICPSGGFSAVCGARPSE